LTQAAAHPTFSKVEGLIDFVISPAGPSDAADLARVHVRSWRETYRGILPQPALDRMSVSAHARRFRLELTRARVGEVTLVAEDPIGAIGYASGGLLDAGRAADAEVFTLYVLKAAQGAGVGRALLTSAARALRAQGARSLMLSVLTDNVRARRFYERLGGVAFGQAPSVGWGAALTETTYRWNDIETLAR
jgi:ribosomal protein S18 acetylase RimI-like enzyme